MRHKDVLDVFLSLACKPHPLCLRRSRAFISQSVRLASTAAPQKGSRSNDAATSSPAARVPLHVGLDRNTEGVSAISRIPIPKGERGEEFTPSVLARPLGLSYPPQPGQNTPKDNRTWSERKADYEDRDKIATRRQVYLRSYFRPYFQEWGRLKHHSGKSFVSNDRLFKRDKALYFPNIWGQTLSSENDGPDGGQDTTPVLMDKISIIAMQGGRWAENQVATFLSPKNNPLLERLLAEKQGQLQRIDINMQGDVARSWLVKLFQPNLRRHIPKDRWSRYFMVKLPRDVRRGLTEEIRDAMGLLNSNVGYVYLVDSDCRIRWAASGDAWEGEVSGMNGAIQRLLQEEDILNRRRLAKDTSTSGPGHQKGTDTSEAEAAATNNRRTRILAG